MTTRPLAGERRPALDGLRAIAVVCFLVYHGQLLWTADERGATILPGGFLAVDMFFVLSAFLITTLLLGEHDRSGRIGDGARDGSAVALSEGQNGKQE